MKMNLKHKEEIISPRQNIFYLIVSVLSSLLLISDSHHEISNNHVSNRNEKFYRGFVKH